jgi:flagellar export protein FliJ
MAFHFALEAVLRLRRSQERAARLKLESIVAEQQRTQVRLRETTERSFEQHRQFQRRLAGGMAGTELQFEMEREVRVKAVCQELQNKIGELEKQRIAQVQTYYATRRNLELVENLRQRKLDDYRTEQARREQQELDALFLLRHKDQS